MVTLCLGESSDLVGEGQRVGEAREVEYALELGDAVALQELPVWDFAPELRALRLGYPWRVVAAGDTPLGGQRAHRGTSELLLASGLCSPDAVFGDLHALDALEAEEQFDEVRRRLDRHPLDNCPERLCTFWLKATPLIVRPLRFTFTRWFGSNTLEPPEDTSVERLFPSARSSEAMVGVAGGLCNRGIVAVKPGATIALADST